MRPTETPANAYDLGRAVEEAGLEALLPFIRYVAYEGQFVLTNKGLLAPMLQQCAGDLLLNLRRPDHLYGVEIKVEEEFRTGNLYLETWSNRSFIGRRAGWMVTLETDFLWYYFRDVDVLYVFNFRKLWEWAFVTPSKEVRGGTGRIYDFRENAQAKYQQRNLTCGRCVPLSVLGQEVGYNAYMPATKGLGWRDRVRPVAAAAEAAA